MHMKTRKRFLALVAAAAMVLAPCTAFAADSVTSPAIGGGTAGGNVEGVVDKEVFTVTLPTLTNQLDFILDPQGVIADSMKSTDGNSKYTGKSFESGATLFFANTTGSTNYTSSSDKLTVVNKSSIPVDVKVDVTATGDAIAFATDKAFTNSTNPEIYLAIVGVTNSAVAVDPETKTATATTQLAAVDSQFYEVKYDAATDSYSYVLKGDTPDTNFAKVEFGLTGACNSAADWTSLASVQPAVDVVWTVSAVTSMQKISSVDDVIAWTNRDEDYTFQIDPVGLGGTEILDIGVYYNKVTYGYNGTWSNNFAMKNVGLGLLDGNTVTLYTKVSPYFPAGASLYVKLATSAGEKVVQIKTQ